jgi:ABC-type branched-subunit amino acid transport system permease subunit
MGALQSLAADPATRPRSAKSRSASVYMTVAVGGALTLLGLLAPAAIHSSYYLGLLINAILLAISAVSIGFLAHQSGLMMFGAAAFTGSATYLYAIAITQFGWNVMAASAFTLSASTGLSAVIGALIVRARPLPFAMLTLALAQMLRSFVLITDFRPITGATTAWRSVTTAPSSASAKPSFRSLKDFGRSHGWRYAASWRWPGWSVDPPPGRCCAPSKPTRSACASPVSILIGLA